MTSQFIKATGTERCHPSAFVSPSEEELAAIQPQMRALINQRALENAASCRGAIFEAWKAGRQEQGLSVDMESNLHPNDFPRLKGIQSYIQTVTDMFPRISFPDFSMKERYIKNPNVVDRNPLVPDTAALTGDCICVDRDGIPFLIKFMDGLNEVSRGTDSQRMEDTLATADNKYKAVFPSHPNVGKNDYRHLRPYLAGREIYYKTKGDNYGASHLGRNASQGYGYVQDLPHAGYGSLSKTQDLRGGATGSEDLKRGRADAGETFLTEIIGADAALGMILKCCAPETFADAKKIRNEMAMCGELTRECEYQWSSFMARVENIPVGGPKDSGDARHTLTGGLCFGEFSGGEFCIPELGIKFCLLPGDVMIMAACLLVHCVQPFVGNRTAHIFTNKVDKYSVLTQYRDMNTEEKENSFRRRKRR